MKLLHRFLIMIRLYPAPRSTPRPIPVTPTEPQEDKGEFSDLLVDSDRADFFALTDAVTGEEESAPVPKYDPRLDARNQHPLYRQRPQGGRRLSWEDWNYPGDSPEAWAGKRWDGRNGPWQTVVLSGPDVRRFGHKGR